LLDGKAAVPSAGKSGGALFNARSNEFIPPAHFDPNSTSFQPAERLPVVVEQVNPYPMNQGAKELHELNYGRTLTSEEILAARNTPLMLEYDARSRDLDAMYQAARSADRPDLAAQILDEQRRLAEDYGVILIDLNKFGGPLVNLPRIGKQTGLARQAGAAIANTGIGIVESFSDAMVWASMGNGTAAKAFAPLFESQMAHTVIDTPKRVADAVDRGETQEAMEAGLGGTVAASMLTGPKYLHKTQTELPTTRLEKPQLRTAGKNAASLSTTENKPSHAPGAENIDATRVGIGHDASTAEQGERGVAHDLATAHPRVRLELTTRDGRTILVDESSPEVSVESVRDKVNGEYPGAEIEKIESWTAPHNGTEKSAADLHQPPADGINREEPVPSGVVPYGQHAQNPEGNGATPSIRSNAGRGGKQAESFTPSRIKTGAATEIIESESSGEQNTRNAGVLIAPTRDALETRARELFPKIRLDIRDGAPPIYNGRYIRGELEPDHRIVLYRQAFDSVSQVKPILIEELGHSFVNTPKGAAILGRLEKSLSPAQINAMRETGYGEHVAREEAALRRSARLSEEPPKDAFRRAWEEFIDAITRFARERGWITLTESDLRDLLRFTIAHGHGGHIARTGIEARSLGKIEPLVEVWTSLADADGIFSYKRRIDARSPEEIARMLSTPAQLIWARRPNGEKIIFETKNGHISLNKINNKTFEIYSEEAGSKGTRGGGGALLHQAAFAYAHNNGFIIRPYGDAGEPGIDATVFLSEINKLRKTANMVSSALRFGTTKHMIPSVAQGVEGWVDGNHYGNIAALLRAEAKMAADRISWINDLQYDPKRNAIRDSVGKTWNDNEIDARLAEIDPRFEKGVGLGTLKRSVITKYLSGLKTGHGASGFDKLKEAIREGLAKNPILYSLGEKAPAEEQ
jgi:hypothetical protein